MPRRPAPPSRRADPRALRDHPALAQVIPALPPRSLTRLYDTVGLNDAGSLMALTPPALLARALDEAVWVEQGGEPRFDADVFVDWLEVWLDEGGTFAVERLLALDEDTLTLCFSEVLRVEDSRVTAFCREPDDGGEPNVDGAGFLELDAGSVELFGPFLVGAAIEDEWDIVHAALTALWSQEEDCLLRLLTRLTAGDSRLTEEADSPLRQDAAAAREARREIAGFVSATAARAFLARSLTSSAAELTAMTGYDLETERHLRLLRQTGEGSRVSEQAATEEVTTGDAATLDAAVPTSATRRDAGDDPTSAAAVDGLWTLLTRAGVVDAPTPARLLAGPRSGAGQTLQRRLNEMAVTDTVALAHTASELAYLANALVSGGGLSGREAEADARELALAAANLGLELLEAGGDTVVLGRPPGLIRPFLLAWRMLVELPSELLRAVERALAAPPTLVRLAERPWLDAQMEEALLDLRGALESGTSEAAAEALTLLSLALDPDACRAALHLLAAPPRFPGSLDGPGREARWIRSVEDLERIGALLGGLTRADVPPTRAS